MSDAELEKKLKWHNKQLQNGMKHIWNYIDNTCT